MFRREVLLWASRGETGPFRLTRRSKRTRGSGHPREKTWKTKSPPGIFWSKTAYGLSSSKLSMPVVFLMQNRTAKTKALMRAIRFVQPEKTSKNTHRYWMEKDWRLRAFRAKLWVGLGDPVSHYLQQQSCGRPTAEEALSKAQKKRRVDTHAATERSEVCRTQKNLLTRGAPVVAANGSRYSRASASWTNRRDSLLLTTNRPGGNGP